MDHVGHRGLGLMPISHRLSSIHRLLLGSGRRRRRSFCHLDRRSDLKPPCLSAGTKLFGKLTWLGMLPCWPLRRAGACMRDYSISIVLGAVASTLVGVATCADAHGGGLNAQGCHNDRKGGTGYHCHGSVSGRVSSVDRSTPLRLSAPPSGGGAFRNCTAARAAGAAPVRSGDAGYGRHLDRDGDGVGCE